MHSREFAVGEDGRKGTGGDASSLFGTAGTAPRDRSRSRSSARPSRGRRSRAVLLPQLLTAAVEAKAKDAAVSFRGGATLSYRELDSRSSQLARFLIDRGVGPGSFVALGVTRSVESIVGMWAIVKAGGAAFVPLDPTYPSDRIEYMISDSGVMSGITTVAHRPTLPSSVDWVVIDDADQIAHVSSLPDRPVSYAERVRPLNELHPAMSSIRRVRRAVRRASSSATPA